MTKEQVLTSIDAKMEHNDFDIKTGIFILVQISGIYTNSISTVTLR